MNPTSPLISVIIPVYNGERYLGEAIASVASQEYRPIEIIVVDDGSTDRSSAIALRFGPPVRCFRQENAGGPAAHAQGVALSKGEFVAFLDADDLWTPGKLQKQIAAFEADPTLDIVFGHVRQFYSPDVAEEAAALGRPKAEVMPGYTCGAMIIRRAAYDRVGPFLSTLRMSEFVEWYGRAVDAGLKQQMQSDIVMLRRLHTTNISITQRGDRGGFVQAAKLMLDRRRSRTSGLTAEQSNGHAADDATQRNSE